MNYDINIFLDSLKFIMQTDSRYIVVKTKYTTHHIERLLGSCRDRGKWKWIAESNQDYWEGLERHDKEAQRSHVDGGDLFPRVYFIMDSFINEFTEWLKVRELNIIDLLVPKI